LRAIEYEVGYVRGNQSDAGTVGGLLDYSRDSA
jgi:hypothetical protein